MMEYDVVGLADCAPAFLFPVLFVIRRFPGAIGRPQRVLSVQFSRGLRCRYFFLVLLGKLGGDFPPVLVDR